mmetsp:Transcript_5288/g.9481  ORF Transcript_5288/g.9481 Transcript_5288/m.9481 type:complete len:288 (+) Transcript_5288:626-1489(+)
MFGHLHGRDDFEGLFRCLQVEEVGQDDLHVFVVAQGLAHALGVLLLVRRHRNPCHLGTLAGEVVGQSAPTTADFQGLVTWLHAQRMCDELQLLLLRGPQGLVLSCVDGTRVNHGLSQRGLEPVVALVVGLWQVVCILVSVMKDTAAEPGPQVALELRLAEDGRILVTFQNHLQIALACRNVILQGFPQGWLIEVVPFCLCIPPGFQHCEAAEENKHQDWKDEYADSEGLPNHCGQHDQACQHVWHVPRDKHDHFKHRKHHGHRHGWFNLAWPPPSKGGAHLTFLVTS